MTSFLDLGLTIAALDAHMDNISDCLFMTIYKLEAHMVWID